MSESRPFRFFRYLPPEKTATDFSDSEKDQLRASFKPAAMRYGIDGYIFIILSFASFLFRAFSKQEDRWWLFCGVILFGIIYSILFGPTCQACKRRVDDGVRTFCPECGGKVSPGRFLKAPQCLSCGKDLWQGKRRSYKRRCCTHCGLFLDDKGI